MGIDIFSLQLLELGRAIGINFNSVLLIGRHQLFMSPYELNTFYRILQKNQIPTPELQGNYGPYSERFLSEVFGASIIDSVDTSDYEGATIVQDMNMPWKPEKQYNVVLDFGTLEHVFNFPVAVSNVIQACKEDGYIIHALPGNNWSGHGFYQFSPELFFSLYSEERGFKNTRVFAAELFNTDDWYVLTSPKDLKARLEISNLEQTYVLVITQKTEHAELPIDSPPYQSDYVTSWEQSEQTLYIPKTTRIGIIRKQLKRICLIGWVIRLGQILNMNRRIGVHGYRKEALKKWKYVSLLKSYYSTVQRSTRDCAKEISGINS